MKNVMTRAWTIARQGAKKFGGTAKEYFAQALVMAWAEKKSTDRQLAELKEKGVKIYNEYIQSVISKGTELISKNGTDVSLVVPHKNYKKTAVVSFEMSGFDVFAKVVIGKQVQFVNVGKVVA